jgi:heat shock protein HtpX
LYELIAANRRRSILLIAAFFVLVAAIGWVFGLLTGFGYYGLAVAVVIAIALTWGSYFYSDRVALAISRARPADPGMYARLHNVTEGLSIAAGIPKPRVYVIDDPAPNAFATGRNPENAAVAVTTGLLEKMNRVELEGVVAHELGHIRNYDILVSTIAVTLAGVVVLLSDWLLRAMWWGGGRRGGRSSGGNPVGLVLVLAGVVLALLAPLIAQLIKAAVSRKRESLADATAVEFTRYPPGLIGGLRKLQSDTTVVRTASRATAHLWIESPLNRVGRGGWLNRLFDTHPPLEERIRALEGL